MGTWLALSKNDRFAAITNYRDPRYFKGARSRGEIVTNFLMDNRSMDEFLAELIANRDEYGGFNVLLYDRHRFVHYNNILNEVNEITPGTHSLSNHSLNTPWPKVVKGRENLHKIISTHQKELPIEKLFDLLADETVAPDEELPHTGVGIEMERHLSSIFIKIPNYGTRTSTILLLDNENRVTFVERTYENGEFQFDNQVELALVSKC